VRISAALLHRVDLVGHEAVQFLSRLEVDLCFMGAHSIHATRGLGEVNQSETESTKETAAAQRSKRRDACSWPPVTRITVDSTWWMYEMVDLPVYD